MALLVAGCWLLLLLLFILDSLLFFSRVPKGTGFKLLVTMGYYLQLHASEKPHAYFSCWIFSLPLFNIQSSLQYLEKL